VAFIVGQVATLTQFPRAYIYADTKGYAVAAAHFAHSITHLDAFRTPGYPLLLGFVEAVTGQHLTGATVCGRTYIPHYGALLPVCQNSFRWMLPVQALLLLAATLTCYGLVYHLTRRRAAACVAAVLICANLYIVSWERTILTELLSFWSIVTVFYCFERFVRRPGLAWGIPLTIMLIVSPLIRPFNVYLPVLLLGLLLLRAIWLRRLRASWKPVALAGALVAVCLLGYMQLNAVQNGFFGLSWDHNVTTMGKVMEYRMQGLPVDARYAGVQADVQEYMATVPATSLPNPWRIMTYYPHDTGTYFTPAGDYAQNLIKRNFVTFAIHSLPDLLKAWLPPLEFYATYGVDTQGNFQADPQGIPGITAFPVYRWGPVAASSVPFWVTGLMVLSTIAQYLYVLLPLLLVLLAWRLWRRREDDATFIELAMLLTVVAGLFFAALGNYDEFYRIRFPVDWAFFAVLAIVAVDLLTRRRATIPTTSGTGPSGGAAIARATPSHEPPPPDILNEATMRNEEYAGLVSGTVPTFADQPDGHGAPEISIVLPCLNEEEAIGGCVETLKEIIARLGLAAEIVVVDNASTDRSAEIARAHGARVVEQPVRGYGNAYLKGFEEARGQYIVMADADNTYDFNELPNFLAPLRQGYDFVNGNRFSGRMAKGAMTWSHRYIGNPALSGLLNLFFHTGLRDAHCGMRAFTKDAYQRMRLRTGGMEFASEMVINAAKAGLKITERPIAYHPRVGDSKLHTLRDGWRHLRFLLLYSPTHLFLLPGLVLTLVGLVTLGALVPGPLPLLGHAWDVHTMILASALTLIGLQIVSLGLFARFFSLTEELDGGQDRLLRWLSRAFTLERGLRLGGLIFLIGAVVDGVILVQWISESMGPLNAVRPAVFATTLLAAGTQI
ncbi:MAG TPA: glycosyltransferase family 2 protein, partial [Ktedonobacterales bacterium]